MLVSPERQLGEARRVLKPGGRLIASTDCYAERRSPREHLQYWRTRAARALRVIAYLNFLHPPDLQRLIEVAGFAIEEERELEYLGITGFFTLAVKS